MTFWTILVISIYSGPFEGLESRLAYPSLAACEAARRAVTDTLSYDYGADCIESNLTSGRMARPKRRPE